MRESMSGSLLPAPLNPLRGKRAVNQCRRSVLRMLTPLLLLGGFMLAPGNEAAGGDWMFRRSYHSHAVPPEVEFYAPPPDSRSAYRVPVVRRYPGFAIRGGQRFNNYTLRSGNQVDWTIIRENWFEIRP